jgi:hypothetical protein
MVDENRKLKYIDTTPFTNFTPEMAEELDGFATELLPTVEEALCQFEELLKEEELKAQMGRDS